VECIYALIDRFQRQKMEINELLPDVRDVGMIRVDCREIRNLLKPSPETILKELQVTLPRIVKERIDGE
jgi:hypothetical protein